MKNFLGVGIAVAVLAGIWTQVSIELSLVTWVAFVAWASFFAAGGGTTGLKKGLAANVSGVAWAYLASLFLEHATWNGAVALAVTGLGLVLCLQAALPVLSFIPGAFVGTAVFFGTSFDLGGSLLALAVGALLGFASEQLAGRIQAAVDRPSVAPAPVAPAA